MKFLSPVMESSLESTQYIQALLLKISVYSVEFNFTTWDQKLLHNAVLYAPRGINVRPINCGAAAVVESVQVEVDDVDRSLYAVFGEQDATEVDLPLTLTLVILSDERKVIADLVLFKGNISQWEYHPGNFKMRATSILEQHSRKTSLTFSESCRWRIFKGVECKYDGPAGSCDRTFSQCLSYNNTENYGGFRFLPSMLNKKLKV